MSRQRSDASERHRTSAPRTPPVVEARRPRGAPSLPVQLGVTAGVVAVVFVVANPVVAAAAVAVAAVVGLVTTAVGRAIDRAAAREATVRVPGAGVEVTLARASGE